MNAVVNLDQRRRAKHLAETLSKPRRHGERAEGTANVWILDPKDPDLGFVYADMHSWYEANDANCACPGLCVCETETS